MVGVVAVDAGTEVDLTERLVERLSHLADGEVGQFLATLFVELGSPPNQGGPFGDGDRSPPGPPCHGGVCQGSLHLGVRRRGVSRPLLTCCRIDRGEAFSHGLLR